MSLGSVSQTERDSCAEEKRNRLSVPPENAVVPRGSTRWRPCTRSETSNHSALRTKSNGDFAAEWPNFSSELNPVAGLSHGDDMTRRGRVLLEFAAQLRDMCVHGPADDRRGVSPNFPHHLQPGDHRSPCSQERKQQIEFLRSQFDGLRCAAYGARSGVNLRKRSSACPAETGPISGGRYLSAFEKGGSPILGFLLGPICQRKGDRPKLWSRAIEFKGHSERSISGASYSEDSAALSHAHSWICE